MIRNLPAIVLILSSTAASACIPTARNSISAPPVTPASLSGAHAGNLSRVTDSKGLLFTCISPTTDLHIPTLHNCTTAPGRTWDEVVHVFLKTIKDMQDQPETK